MAFRSVVLNAMDSWEELLRDRVRQLDRHSDPESDSFRTSVLKDLHRHCCVSFTGWRAEEVTVFTQLSFPRDTLVRLTANGRISEFFEYLHEKWKPSFFDWARMLWHVTSRAHKFFADLLYLLPSKQRPSKAEMGHALFSEMIREGIIRHRTVASVVGALIKWPLESTMAMDHASQIYEFSKDLTPVEVGLVCRSLIIYRRREQCECGYERKEEDCRCRWRYIENNYRGPRGEVLEFDLDKEYACGLCNLILKQHERGGDAGGREWNGEQQGQFIRSACEFVFSEHIYLELYQNLNYGREPSLKQEHPRPLTEREERLNLGRSADEDYDHSFAQHAGCVEQNCKQSSKQGCANVSCKTHCDLKGRNACRVHRHYDPLGPPSYPPRILGPLNKNRHRRVSRD